MLKAKPKSKNQSLNIEPSLNLSTILGLGLGPFPQLRLDLSFGANLTSGLGPTSKIKKTRKRRLKLKVVPESNHKFFQSIRPRTKT